MPKLLVGLVSTMLTVFMVVISPFTLLSGYKTESITNAEENCLLSFAAISDLHLRDNFLCGGMLRLGLEDMASATDRLDAVVFDGDITDHGYVGMWDRFANAVADYDIADNTFVVVGNHDTWGPNREDFFNSEDGVLTTFAKYNKIVSGREISHMYYSDVVNGYYMIALGSEDDCTDAYISPEQLTWFAAEMEKASETGLPIFVLLHQPVNGTHGLPYNWELNAEHPFEKGGIGDQSDDVLAILKKYDNVFYISGHVHAGLKNEGDLGVEYASVEYLENNNGNKITLINLPSYLYPDVQRGGHLANGCGFVIEAYSDKVMIRARNFAVQTWLPEYDVTVELV